MENRVHALIIVRGYKSCVHKMTTAVSKVIRTACCATFPYNRGFWNGRLMDKNGGENYANEKKRLTSRPPRDKWIRNIEHSFRFPQKRMNSVTSTRKGIYKPSFSPKSSWAFLLFLFFLVPLITRIASRDSDDVAGFVRVG